MLSHSLSFFLSSSLSVCLSYFFSPFFSCHILNLSTNVLIPHASFHHTIVQLFFNKLSSFFHKLISFKLIVASIVHHTRIYTNENFFLKSFYSEDKQDHLWINSQIAPIRGFFDATSSAYSLYLLLLYGFFPSCRFTIFSYFWEFPSLFSGLLEVKHGRSCVA